MVLLAGDRDGSLEDKIVSIKFGVMLKRFIMRGMEKGFAIGKHEKKKILSTPSCSDNWTYPQGRTPINSQ